MRQLLACTDPASPQSIPAPADGSCAGQNPTSTYTQQFQWFEPWQCQGAESGTGSRWQHCCMGWMLQVPLTAPGLSQHQNLGRLLVSSCRDRGDCFAWVFSPSETEASNYLHATILELANGRGKPAGRDRRCCTHACSAMCHWGSCLPPPHRQHTSSLSSLPTAVEERHEH